MQGHNHETGNDAKQAQSGVQLDSSDEGRDCRSRVVESPRFSAPSLFVLRNISSNVVGVVLPAVAALIAVPLLLDQLGMAAFGVFSLQVAALFFFGLSDLGISRAIVLLSFDREFGGSWQKPYRIGLKFSLLLSVAVLLAAIPTTLWLLYATPAQVPLHDLVISTILVLGSASLTLLMQAPRAVLEAQERFVLSNAIRAPAAAAIFLAPVVALSLEQSLTSAAISLLLTRVAAAASYFWACGHFTEPLLRQPMSREVRSRLRSAFVAKAGWLGLTNMLSMLLAYMDRFVLGALGTATLVGQYVIAQEVVTKAWISSGAVISAAMPRLAAARHSGEEEGLSKVTAQMHGLMLLAGVLPALILVLFGPALLKLWLGRNFDPASAMPLQLMAIGLGVNTLAQVNFSLLQVLGGEKHGALLQVFGAVVLGVGLATLVPLWGVMGAAATFTIRLVVDAFIVRWLLSRVEAGGRRLGVRAAILVLWAAVLSACWLAPWFFPA